jgi:enterochelin esterase family protein
MHKTSGAPLFIYLALSAALAVRATGQVDGAAQLESPTLQQLRNALTRGDSAVLSKFWGDVAGHVPLVEEIAGQPDFRYVTFLWRGDAATREVSVGLGDIPTPNPTKWQFTHLANTDLWFKTDRAPKDARFGYLLRVNRDPLQPDPLNPHSFAGRSVVELPDAPPQSWIVRRPDSPEGRLQKDEIYSSILKEQRGIGIYTPPGYSGKNDADRLLVVVDGEAYGNDPDPLVPTPRILDNLLAAGKIPPTVAILVNTVSELKRERDLKCSDHFEAFLAEELVPWVRRNYHVSKRSADVVVAGSSDGGLLALCEVHQYPNVFGNALSQSGDIFYDPHPKQPSNPYTSDAGWLVRQFLSMPRVPVRFYLEIGTLEAGVVNPVNEHRRLRDVLIARGYDVSYAEFSGGHDYLTWRNSLGDGLIALLGRHR